MGSSKDDALEISRMLTFIPELATLFHVKEKVGEGTFSKVYRAVVKNWDHENKKEYALKYLVPTSRPCRIASELQCLKQVGGSNNIVGIELCLMHQGHVVIVMPYFPHQRFVDYVKFMTYSDIKDYMKNLFIALAKTHAHGIIHRDVKPNNFLYDRERKRYALVDFGLAQRLHEYGKRPMPPHMSIQPFKEHNILSADDKAHRNEATNAKDKQAVVHRRPHQSVVPLVLSQKRTLESNQENGNPPKRRALDLSQNEACPPLYSKTSFLPTPPHTPSSRSPAVIIKPPENVSGYDAKRKRKDVTAHQKVCSCYGMNTVCKLCLGRVAEEAPRGGTPGFRAPEVLLKYKNQTTAVDMWSAGVILLSMLSRKYPFFRAEDDLSSLGEIILLVGVEEMKQAAAAIGKSVTLNLPGFSNVTKLRSYLSPTNYLKNLCTALVDREQTTNQNSLNVSSSSGNQPLNRVDVPDSAYDLLNRLLDPNPLTRITAKEALVHPFIMAGS